VLRFSVLIGLCKNLRDCITWLHWNKNVVRLMKAATTTACIWRNYVNNYITVYKLLLWFCISKYFNSKPTTYNYRACWTTCLQSLRRVIYSVIKLSLTSVFIYKYFRRFLRFGVNEEHLSLKIYIYITFLQWPDRIVATMKLDTIVAFDTIVSVL
jgi:hypothetical protein